jgi:hypothetical protein
MTSHRERGRPVVIFRPGISGEAAALFFHWGIGMWSWNAVCQVWGSGANPLPLALVEDVARALMAALGVPSIPWSIRPAPWCWNTVRRCVGFSTTTREALFILPACEWPRLCRRFASRSNGTWTRKKGVRREATRPSGRVY